MYMSATLRGRVSVVPAEPVVEPDELGISPEAVPPWLPDVTEPVTV